MTFLAVGPDGSAAQLCRKCAQWVAIDFQGYLAALSEAHANAEG